MLSERILTTSHSWMTPPNNSSRRPFTMQRFLPSFYCAARVRIGQTKEPFSLQLQAASRPESYPMLPVLRVAQATIYGNFVVQSPVLISRIYSNSLCVDSRPARDLFPSFILGRSLRLILPDLQTRVEPNLTVFNIATSQSQQSQVITR